MGKIGIVYAWFQKSETTSCNKQVYALQKNVSHNFIPRKNLWIDYHLAYAYLNLQ